MFLNQKRKNILFTTDTALPHYLPSDNILLNNMLWKFTKFAYTSIFVYAKRNNSTQCTMLK